MLFPVLVIGSCNTINPDESIPSYLYIPAINLTTTPEQGPNSHEIIDGWVYLNDALLGVYQLPALIPFNKTGYFKVEVRGGIRQSGQGNDRLYYPFYTTYVKYTTLYPKTIDTLGPITLTYKSNAKFEFIEAFDEPSTKFERIRGSAKDTFYRVSESKYTWGGSGGAGKLEMKSDTALVEINTLNEYLLPGGDAQVYLEMDYRNNSPFTVGFIANQKGLGQEYNPVSILTLYPTDTTWHKLYISLRGDIGSQGANSKYKIFFRSNKSQVGFTSHIYFDNIKLIRFE